MSGPAINYRDQRTLREMGLAALKDRLGSVGMVYFIRQFATGSGDYTKERITLHESLTFDEIVKGAKEMDAVRNDVR